MLEKKCYSRLPRLRRSGCDAAAGQKITILYEWDVSYAQHVVFPTKIYRLIFSLLLLTYFQAIVCVQKSRKRTSSIGLLLWFPWADRFLVTASKLQARVVSMLFCQEKTLDCWEVARDDFHVRGPCCFRLNECRQQKNVFSLNKCFHADVCACKE